MKRYSVVIGKEVLVNRGKAVKLAINACFLFQLAQDGFFHTLSEADASADGVIKRAFFIRIARHQNLSSAVDNHARAVVEFSLLCLKCAVHDTTPCPAIVPLPADFCKSKFAPHETKITAEKQRLLFKPVYSISVRALGNDETILY